MNLDLRLVVFTITQGYCLIFVWSVFFFKLSISMSNDIKFLSLQKTELAYEIEIRGETPAATVQELRKQIVKLVQLFPSEDILESHYGPIEDITAVEDSLTKVDKNLKTLLSTPDKNLYDRTNNLLNHIYHRLNRIDCSDQPESLPACGESMKRFQRLRSQLLTIKPHSSITFPDVPENPTHTTVSCDRSLTSDLSKLKFNGKTCVRAFILRVTDFIKARNIPSSKIFSFATEIFTDDALHWFRSIQDNVTTWEGVCDRLRDDFSQFDYDYRFLTEIRARTQGERENITIYLSIMSSMFSQLDRKLSNEDMLEILLHNIRPCYANVLTSNPDIKDIDTLRTICKNYEKVHARLSQFREPPKISSETLAPECAYSHASTSTVNNKPFKPNYQNHYNQSYLQQRYTKSHSYYKPNNNSNHNKFTESSPPDNHCGSVDLLQPVETIISGPIRKFCPRCRVDTHNLRNCTAERKIVCFRCHKPGFRFPECPDCQKPSASGETKNA